MCACIPQDVRNHQQGFNAVLGRKALETSLLRDGFKSGHLKISHDRKEYWTGLPKNGLLEIIYFYSWSLGNRTIRRCVLVEVGVAFLEEVCH